MERTPDAVAVVYEGQSLAMAELEPAGESAGAPSEV